jgi:hypothetical protein
MSAETAHACARLAGRSAVRRAHRRAPARHRGASRRARVPIGGGWMGVCGRLPHPHGPSWGGERPGPMQAGCGPRVVLGSVPATRGRGLGGHPGTTPGPQRAPPDRCAGRVARTPVRRWRRPPWSWGGAASAVAWSSCLGVGPTATVTPGDGPPLVLLPGCGAHRAHIPSLGAGPGQEGRQTGSHPEGVVSCPYGP